MAKKPKLAGFTVEPEQGDVLADSPENIVPTIGSPKWHDYVMSQFQEGELHDGNPTVVGLRRVCAQLGFIITHNISKVISCAHIDNFNRVTAENYLQLVYEGQEYTYGDSADVYGENTESKYIIFPTALACTRAEGRSLRKALYLQGNVVAAEEATDKPDLKVADETGEKLIEDFQKAALKNLAKKCKIDVDKMLKKSQFGPFHSLETVTYNAATRLIQSLNKWQANLGAIPEEIRVAKV